MSIQLDWDKLGFCLTPTDKMFLAKTMQEASWQAGQLVPYGNLEISPAAGVLNYGQGIFEGMKAYRTRHGEIVLFRPSENAKRFYDGAAELCMPPVPVDYFLEAVKSVVIANQAYIPPYGKGSLYIRPCLWGTGGVLGVGPAPSYTFVVYASPVGPYYKNGLKPIRVLVSDDYHRAAPHGVGHIKCIGNYAGTLLSLKKAKQQAFEGCLYLDAKHSRYVEEVGTANFFCVINNTLLTPKLGSILPGVTRDSIIKLAKHEFGIEVEERDIDINDVIKNATECFCVGTAAVVTPIGEIQYQHKIAQYPDLGTQSLAHRLYDYLTDIQQGKSKDPFGWIVPVDVNV